jgi:hypothetical protein
MSVHEQIQPLFILHRYTDFHRVLQHFLWFPAYFF